MSIKITQQDFLERCKKVHGDRYDYSKVVYTKQNVKVPIICKEHGEFLQSPEKHWIGRGCPKCKGKNIANKLRGNIDSILETCRKVHNNKYDYSQVEYINLDSKVKIICPEHGIFWQTLALHKQGKTGCWECRSSKISSTKLPTTKDLIKKFKLVHGDIYDYSLVDYVKSSDKVKILCKKHGMFEQATDVHLRPAGCPRCAHLVSSQEDEVYEFLLENGIEAQRSVWKVLKRNQLDLYIPEKKLAIEINGIWWHSDNKKDKNYHYDKMKECRDLGIRLIQISDADWRDNKTKMKSIILNALNIHKSQDKVNARDCEIVHLTSKEVKDFLEDNHPQGHASNKVNLGLRHPTKGIVAVMSFGFGKTSRGTGRKTETWELSRYATSCNVRGGASKLFKSFAKEFNPEEVKSFSMNDWFTGGVYKILGFKGEEIKPDYRVWHYRTGLKPKSYWQRRNIPKRIIELGKEDQISFNPETDERTEWQVEDELGALRLWDSGKIRWIWKPEYSLN